MWWSHPGEYWRDQLQMPWTTDGTWRGSPLQGSAGVVDVCAFGGHAIELKHLQPLARTEVRDAGCAQIYAAKGVARCCIEQAGQGLN